MGASSAQEPGANSGTKDHIFTIGPILRGPNPKPLYSLKRVTLPSTASCLGVGGSRLWTQADLVAVPLFLSSFPEQQRSHGQNPGYSSGQSPAHLVKQGVGGDNFHRLCQLKPIEGQDPLGDGSVASNPPPSVCNPYLASFTRSLAW